VNLEKKDILLPNFAKCGMQIGLFIWNYMPKTILKEEVKRLNKSKALLLVLIPNNF
jgi:hypothetical protein